MTFRGRDEKYLTLQGCQKMPNAWWQGGYRTGGRGTYPCRAGQQVLARRRTGSPHRGDIAARPHHGAGTVAGVCCPQERWGRGGTLPAGTRGGTTCSHEGWEAFERGRGWRGGTSWELGVTCAGWLHEARQYLVIWTDRGGQEGKGTGRGVAEF